VSDNGVNSTRSTRVTAAGEVRVPTRGMNTLMTHVLETWNTCAELRDSKSKTKDKPGSNKPCKKVPAVRQSLFGHLERSNSLRDGDKTGNFFSEVSKSVFPVEKIGDQRDHQERLQQEPCQAAAVRRGK
jgi:hypothetical protein